MSIRTFAIMARASFGSTAKLFEDYRELLARNDIDIVTIGAPDHWHAKMLIDACRAGKDVYCEKPLTLTVDEGKLIRKVVKDTGRVVQVGLQAVTVIDTGKRWNLFARVELAN